jgi:hypothetical protein
MWAITNLAMIDAMPLQNIETIPVDLAMVLRRAALPQDVTPLADDCRTVFLHIV